MDEWEQPMALGRLGSFSKRLASALFADFPTLEARARMVMLSEPDGFSLFVEVPSPTLDENRTLQIWVDESATPSFDFGPDHTLGAPDDEGIEEILRLTQAAVDGRLVIATDVGGTHDGHRAWLDTSDPMALLSELTRRQAPDAITLKSFLGSADRTVRLSDLTD